MVASTDSKMTKTAFLTAFFQKNPKATVKTVREAWTEAGYPGSVSGTLVSKLRSELGLAGNLRARSQKVTLTLSGTPKKPVGRPKGSFKTRVETMSFAHNNGASTPKVAAKAAPATKSDRVLDSVEAGIDDLIFTLKGVGGFADVETALRAARRMVSRSTGE